MINIVKLVFLFSLLFSYGCNQNKSKEEMDELWSKANTTGEIINRSGTIFNSGTDKDLAMRDAKTRLQSGKEGGIFGKEGFSFDTGLGNSGNKQRTTTVGIPINPFLWRASLEVIDFMPLASADPFGGIIITDWYSTVSNEDERCKLNIFINGIELKTQNLKPMARIVSSAIAGVSPSIMGIGPVLASNKALKRAGLTLDDMDILELNEAFSAQVLACLKEMNVENNDPRINPNGGAIALGHPLGMSGSRILLTAARQLQASNKRYALVAMCIGVGQGYATIIERT